MHIGPQLRKNDNDSKCQSKAAEIRLDLLGLLPVSARHIRLLRNGNHLTKANAMHGWKKFFFLSHCVVCWSVVGVHFLFRMQRILTPDIPKFTRPNIP